MAKFLFDVCTSEKHSTAQHSTKDNSTRISQVPAFSKSLLLAIKVHL